MRRRSFSQSLSKSVGSLHPNLPLVCWTHITAFKWPQQPPSKSVESLHPDLSLVCWTPSTALAPFCFSDYSIYSIYSIYVKWNNLSILGVYFKEDFDNRNTAWQVQWPRDGMTIAHIECVIFLWKKEDFQGIKRISTRYYHIWDLVSSHTYNTWPLRQHGIWIARRISK